jgi:hypothetical protein
MLTQPSLTTATTTAIAPPETDAAATPVDAMPQFGTETPVPTATDTSGSKNALAAEHMAAAMRKGIDGAEISYAASAAFTGGAWKPSPPASPAPTMTMPDIAMPRLDAGQDALPVAQAAVPSAAPATPDFAATLAPTVTMTEIAPPSLDAGQDALPVAQAAVPSAAPATPDFAATLVPAAFDMALTPAIPALDGAGLREETARFGEATGWRKDSVIEMPRREPEKRNEKAGSRVINIANLTLSGDDIFQLANFVRQLEQAVDGPLGVEA